MSSGSLPYPSVKDSEYQRPGRYYEHKYRREESRILLKKTAFSKIGDGRDMRRFTVLLALIVILISAEAFAAADSCTAGLELRSDEYYLDLPIVKYTDASGQTHYYYGEFLYVPKGDDQYWFKLTSAGERVDTSSYSSCQPSTLAYSGSVLMLHINNLEFNNAYFSIDLEYSPSTDGYTWFVVTETLEAQASPFGFIMGDTSARDKTITGMADLGAKWIRLSGVSGIIWERVEKTKGQYDWTEADNMLSAFSQKGLSILVTIGASNKIYQSESGYLPKDIKAYKAFLSAAAERYDGDGLDDAPGAPAVSAWQIGNEVEMKTAWMDSPENYAELMKASYEAVKSASAAAKVVIAGMGTGDSAALSKYSQILSSMKDGVYFDVFDFHWHAVDGGNYKEHKTKDSKKVLNFDKVLSEVKDMLTAGNHENAEIWITEMSASDIIPTGNTEKTQAVDLIKRYVYPAVNGVNKVFWGTLYEQSGFGGQTAGNTNYFDTQGLVNNPGNDGSSHNKLAYYSYKKMVEVLGESAWKDIQKIQESDGIYIYKFLKNGTPVWVAWNDNPDSRLITILEVDSIQVKITQAVPNYASGQDVTDYSRAFSTETKAASNTAISVSLGEAPVFVEGLR